MSDYPNERDCEHGHLRRQCPICELEAENKELRSRLGDVQQLYEEYAGHCVACTPYLKEHETPAECIARNRADVTTTLGMLAKDRKALEECKAERDSALLRLSDCESALRSLDVGRESSYWVVERQEIK